MATPTRRQAEAHYARQASIAALAVRTIRELFKRSPAEVPARVAAFQYAAAVHSTRWVAGLVDDAPLTRPEAFAGWTSEGLRVSDALTPLVDELAAAKSWVDAELFRLDRAVASQVQDAGRSASQVEFSSRPDWTNYVRMLTAPSCARCAILAGRIYRDLEAFQRHPNCDCVMVPVTSWQEAHDAGLVSSFRAAFEAGDVTGLSKGDRRAIAEGANVNRVVNAQRGTVRVGGLAVTPVMGRGRYRLRPEAIYKLAGDDFVKRLTLLKQHGYLAADVDPASLMDGPERGRSLPVFRPGQDDAARRVDELMRGASSGGGKPPVPPRAQRPHGDDPEWERRQRALEGPLFTANSADLKPGEVEFVERMVAAGHKLEWIPEDVSNADEVGTLPQNDFTWHHDAAGNSMGIQVEHKGLEPETDVSAKSIMSQVSKAMQKNRRVLTVTNVIVDVGDRDVSAAIRDEVSRYRLRYPHAAIDRLWLMSRGRVVEVSLK